MGLTPGVITPPVAMILTRSQPACTCSRTALTTSSTPSATRPMRLPWPPVMQIMRPAARMVGPMKAPRAMALRTENSR